MKATELPYEVYQRGKEGGLVKSWTKGVDFDWKARNQTMNIADLPFIHKHVAIMPDVHLGKGATIGSVIPTKGAVVPAAVGVDIGCGMCAVSTSLFAENLPDSLTGVRGAIEDAVPVGKAFFRDGPCREAKNVMKSTFRKRYSLDTRLQFITGPYMPGHNLVKRANAAAMQLGTLGGGNHFIELCLDEEDRVWIMLHSGSRGIGNAIGQHFISLAQQDMRRYHVNLPDKDLAYIPEGTKHFDEYVVAVEWAQDYARANRDVMMLNVVEALRGVIGPFMIGSQPAVNCHHNYIAMENHFGENVWVTRKGAVRAREGDLGIIPGSMGAKSFIVRGKGNPQSFHSCSHGAGRVMSRSAAKRQFSVEDHEKATEGVECRKDEGVIDETPAAYKDIESVMAAQSDLVEVVHTLKQIVCVKG